MKNIYCDVVIAGCGVAGLYTAMHLPQDKKILMLSKEDVAGCDSMLAQGGICVLRDANDYELYFEDTMRAGHYENRKESVDIMIRGSRAVIDHLLSLGVRFEKNADGSLAYTREGAHSQARICFHKDITGEEITTTLLSHVRKMPNITIMEYMTMIDIMTSADQADCSTSAGCSADIANENNYCTGMIAKNAQGETVYIHAEDAVMATGGIGGLYQHSTNFPFLTGDACRIAKEHGVELEHMDYVQIHPTCLYSKKPGRCFLISESARGEGAIILNHKGERFTDELQPRDVVTEAIHNEMEKEGVDHEFLSFEKVPAEIVKGHFPHIYERCMEEGYDILKEPVPIVPAQHYFMGGVHVDSDSQTTMKHLFAVGETSCNGVHGRNRLASNSLLESLVFAQRAAAKIEYTQKGSKKYESDYNAACC